MDQRLLTSGVPVRCSGGVVRHGVHELVADGVDRHDRQAALGLPEGEDAEPVGSERRKREERIVEAPLDIDHAEHAAVPAVHAVPVLPRRQVVVREAHVGVRVHHRRIGPGIVGIARHVAGTPDDVSQQQVTEMLGVVAQIERDDLRGAQAVVGLKRTAGPRGAELLALAQNAVAGADRLLPHGAHVMRDESAVGVQVVGPQIAHGRAVRQHVPAAGNLHDDELRQCVRQHTDARLPLQQLEGFDRLESGLRIELDAGLDRAQERDGRTAGQLPRHAGAEYRNTFVVLLEELLRAALELQVRTARREHQLAAGRQRLDQRV